MSELKADILTTIEEYQPGTSFAELDKRLEDIGWDVDGDLAIKHPDHENVFLWFGLTDPYFDAFSELFSDGDIIAKPADAMVYIMDGAYPQDIDIAERVPPGGYTNPRWAPYLLYPNGDDE